MKKIEYGVKYDTGKATLIGEASSPHFKSDFGHWSAGLYRTGSGRFFLAGEGGPMTQFSQPAIGGGRTGGEDIIPLDRDGAFQWAQDNLDVETVEEYFQDMVEYA